MESCGSVFKPMKDLSELGHEEPDAIDAVNELQERLASCGLSLDVPLPQIVVLGCESAGKSSLLESIVGREFLPRGTGVVTRRPTIVQLITSEAEEDYAIFTHKPQEKFTDFQDVKTEITDETNKCPGPVGFSSKPIILRIYSPKVLKLTLVDLPGLIKVAIGGSSEDDIEEIQNMALEYICHPNSLILAVSPANQELSNSHALEVAKIVDPERVRTIGVLTKLDLAEDGTQQSWIEVLENKKLPLLKGYVGIVSRSQTDNDAGRDIAYGINKEKEFFLNSCYRHIAHKMGSPYLHQILHKELKKHIKEMLPKVRLTLSQKLTNVRKDMIELENLVGKNCGTNTVHLMMIRLVQTFAELMDVEIYGLSTGVAMDKLSAGALIKSRLNMCVKNLSVPEIPEPKQLLRIIINIHGVRNFWSIPSLAADAVSNQLLSKYIKPLNKCVDSIVEVLHSCIETVATSVEHYPNLRIELLELIRKSIEDAAFHTKEALEMHIKAEKNSMNTNHQDFEFPKIEMKETLQHIKLWIDESSEIADVISNPNTSSYEADVDDEDGSSSDTSSLKASETSNDTNVLDKTLSGNACAQRGIDLLKEIIMRYLEIQKKQISNTAIKYIMSFLVDQVMVFIKRNLITALLESKNFDVISADCQRDSIRLKKLKESCECLEDAMKSVQRFE